MIGVHTLVFVKVQVLQVMGNIGVMTDGTTLLIITQVSSGLKIVYAQVLQIRTS